MNNYEVVAERDGKFWSLEVVGVGFTQARNWGEIEDMARDLVVCLRDVALEDVSVDVRVAMSEELNLHVQRSIAARRLAQAASEEALAEARIAAEGLQKQGCSIREIGFLLNLSHQRAHQLLKSA
jgi:hypothetical protein